MVAAKRLQGEIAIGHLVVGIAIGKRNRLVHHHFAHELRDGLAFVEPLSTDAGERLVGGGLVERDEAGRPAIGEVLMIERDRKRVGWGKGVSVGVDLGGGRYIKKKKKQ